MKTLSIIIPSYNTEKFIDKNMSVFFTEGILDNLEILIINDGSKDNTEKKARVWEEKFPEVVNVISKENGGHGSVINTGIRYANGKYFKVIDGDDWVDIKGLISLAKFLEQSEIDLIINSFYTLNETNNKYKKHSFSNVEYGKEYVFEDIVKSVSYIPLHAWTIRTDILKNNNIKVTEKCFYEDFQYVIYPVPYIKNVIFLQNPVYVYLVGQQSQSVSDNSVLKNVDMHTQIIEDSIHYYNKIECSSVKKIYIQRNILNLIKSHYNIYLRNYNVAGVYENLKNFDSYLMDISDEFYIEVAKKYKYIKYVRKNQLFFLLNAVFLKGFKSVSR